MIIQKVLKLSGLKVENVLEYIRDLIQYNLYHCEMPIAPGIT
jgi:hypothetical protein